MPKARYLNPCSTALHEPAPDGPETARQIAACVMTHANTLLSMQFEAISTHFSAGKSNLSGEAPSKRPKPGWIRGNFGIILAHHSALHLWFYGCMHAVSGMVPPTRVFDRVETHSCAGVLAETVSASRTRVHRRLSPLSANAAWSTLVPPMDGLVENVSAHAKKHAHTFCQNSEAKPHHQNHNVL
jgi:hypothetical protein